MTTLALTAALVGALLLGAPAALAAEGLDMQARVLLEGNVRAGSWMAIEVLLRNDGPPITGELRLGTENQSRTRFGMAVELATQSNKRFILHAQPPTFGAQVDVSLVAGGTTLARQEVAFTVRQPAQLVVGVIAEQPERVVPHLDLLPGPSGENPAIVALGPEDLPDRVEAWNSIDRLIWQDVDSALLTPEQVAALRGWLAGGGRLIIAGGTAGPTALAAFPEDLLPYVPTATVDVSPGSLTSILGSLPADASDLPALGGALVRGRPLARVGDRAVAAQTAFGSGSVTILGFDPGTSWIVESGSAEDLWRGLIPQRSGGPVIVGDDGQVVNAVTQLPALALPPIGGLLALLAGYIILIGPVNYLVLRRLDRREWAWLTMPVLIAVFAAAAYGFGAALRGLDVIVNEVAIVRGAPDATEGTAQVYLGVFSPTRGTYQLEVPGGALLSSTYNSEFGGSEGGLDVLQGDPAKVRDLAIGFGSLRTLRAETPTAVPRIQADLRLEDGVLRGTVRNLSGTTLEKPAVVLGSSAIVLRDLGPGAEQSIELTVRAANFGQSLSDKIVGSVFFGDTTRVSDTMQRNLVRHGIIDQLTWDPNFGNSASLPAEGPVFLAWGREQVLSVTIQGQQPRRTGNVLYYIPLGMGISGATAFDGDLLQRSVVEVDATYFNVSPYSIDLGLGEATVAYRPIAFEGSFKTTNVLLSANWGGEPGVGFGNPRPVRPAPACEGDECAEPSATPGPEESCDPNFEECLPDGKFWDGIPEVEVFDRTGDGEWLRVPHMTHGDTYELEDPARFVDPDTGTILVRFISEHQEGASFAFQIRLEGEIE
jgi:hypothetical protein